MGMRPTPVARRGPPARAGWRWLWLALCALAGPARAGKGQPRRHSPTFQEAQAGLDDLRAELVHEHCESATPARARSANPLYVHLHIPKCAGMTFYRAYEPIIGPQLICNRWPNQGSRGDLLGFLTRAWDGDCTYLSYEMTIEAFRAFAPPHRDVRLITMLRDPTQHVLSQIAHQYHKRRGTVAEIFDYFNRSARAAAINRPLPNGRAGSEAGGLQTLYLGGGGGGPWPLSLGQGGQRPSLRRALATLKSGAFWFIGIVDLMPASVCLLKHFLKSGGDAQGRRCGCTELLNADSSTTQLGSNPETRFLHNVADFRVKRGVAKYVSEQGGVPSRCAI
mmetsp:Transcript_9252/g.23440  ORF Transcript_9252/g.23440 Transcript_9252/m.23440 type:complete len:336 (+) Transcript_9252:96-1103(+)